MVEENTTANDIIIQLDTTIPYYAKEHGINMFRVSCETIEFTKGGNLGGVIKKKLKCGPENFTKIAGIKRINYTDTLEDGHFIRTYYALIPGHEGVVFINEQSFRLPQGAIRIKNATLEAITFQGPEEITAKSIVSFVIITLCYVTLVHLGINIVGILKNILLP